MWPLSPAFYTAILTTLIKRWYLHACKNPVPNSLYISSVRSHQHFKPLFISLNCTVFSMHHYSVMFWFCALSIEKVYGLFWGDFFFFNKLLGIERKAHSAEEGWWQKTNAKGLWSFQFPPDVTSLSKMSRVTAAEVSCSNGSQVQCLFLKENRVKQQT